MITFAAIEIFMLAYGRDAVAAAASGVRQLFPNDTAS